MYVRIRASEMAKFIGKNPYISAEDAINLFWERNPAIAKVFNVEIDDSSELERSIQRCSNKQRCAIAAELGICEESPSDKVAAEVAAQIVARVSRTPTTLQADQAISTLPAAMSPIASTINEESQKMRGVLRESASIAKTEEETVRVITARNDKHYEINLFNIQGYKVTLGGKIDGAFEDDGSIVEIKERRNRLFKRINSYEMVQLHCYMRLTGQKKAHLIERYNSFL